MTNMLFALVLFCVGVPAGEMTIVVNGKKEVYVEKGAKNESGTESMMKSEASAQAIPTEDFGGNTADSGVSVQTRKTAGSPGQGGSMAEDALKQAKELQKKLKERDEIIEELLQ